MLSDINKLPVSIGLNENNEYSVHCFFVMTFKLNFSILKGDIASLQKTQHYAKQYQENMETLKKIGMTDAVRSTVFSSFVTFLVNSLSGTLRVRVYVNKC